MREEQHWIPLSDGCRLATTLFRPDLDRPQPVVLEALPYRKDDLTANYAGEYRRLVTEGDYVVARVDLRGTGSSPGIAIDEYPAQERVDLCEAIAWLADQPWSTGGVGMYGTSYSGFNAIHLAMKRPPALKAICAIYATDDRYTDDVHYEGGARRAMDFVDYTTYMVAMNALPPVPSVYGEGWHEEWLRRIEATEPWMLRWLDEQHDGEYWRHGSLRPGYDAIECATMIVGGWADGYRNATLRMFEQLSGPKRMLIGPWGHQSAETALPGPHIDLVPELLRWWDRWLRGDLNGLDDEPPITLFVRRSTKPEPDGAEIRGEWHTERGWPLPELRDTVLPLDEAVASAGADTGADRLEVRGDVGAAASLSCAGALPWGQPFDQRQDEAFSLTYDWPAVSAERELLGYPVLEVELAASAPVAFLSAKLSDVFADGTSSMVSRGFLNLTTRDSARDPQPLGPGTWYRVLVPLTATSWVFERGHRVRLALAGTDWPNVWPPPEPVTLSVRRTGSRLVLPLRALRGADAPRPRLQPPPAEWWDAEATKQLDEDEADTQPVLWRLEHDVLARRSRVVTSHRSVYRADNGAHVVEDYDGRTAVSTTDPGDAAAVGRAAFELAWPEATVASEVHSSLRSDRQNYTLELELDVTQDGERVATRRWERVYPRRLQ
ncbi:MAG: CocE/NonD family hydrolase [Egibacteraceae bacterium]